MFNMFVAQDLHSEAVGTLCDRDSDQAEDCDVDVSHPMTPG